MLGANSYDHSYLDSRRCPGGCGKRFGLDRLLGQTERPSFHSIDITGADYADGFSLTDHNGQARTLADFKGKAVVIFFGFTQCPDVCPTSMSELAQARQMLGRRW